MLEELKNNWPCALLYLVIGPLVYFLVVKYL